MEGLGEKFQPQLNSGTFDYLVPLKLPSVRGGNPTLALEYSPGNENGMLGFGWKCKLPYISRQTDKGLPRYIPSDFFCDENAEELVHLADNSYRQKIESLFVRYAQTTNGGWNGNVPDGTTLTFGSTSQSRLDWGTNGTFRWMVDSSIDPKGNLVRFGYIQDSGQIYPSQIDYGLHTSQASSMFSVKFAYSSRPDPFVDCRPRFAITNRLQLDSITVVFGSRRIRHWQFGYNTNANVLLLSSVTEFGDARSLTNAGSQVNVDYLPPTKFAYTPFNFTNHPKVHTLSFDSQEQNFSFDNEGGGGRAEFVDINHDGLPDILINSDNTWRSLINPGARTNIWPLSLSITNPPPVTGTSLGQTGVRLVDLNGDGKVKLMLAQDSSGTQFYYYDFVSPTALGENQIYQTESGIGLSDNEVQFVDLDDDKAMDILRLDPNSGILEALYTCNYLGKPNIYSLVDMPPGVQFDFAGADPWQFADINGDRLQDFVQLNGTDNTEVCLNLGLGNFAPPYLMTGGPDQSELLPNNGTSGPHLVDINQDGLADLLIVENGDVKIWFNQNGTNWAGPFILYNTPPYESGQTAVRFADINGNGSTDIIWHQNQDGFIQFIDLFPSGKANLLNKVTTTLGGTLNVYYSSSTDFLTQDASAGNAWTSVCPFAIPAVSQIVEGDGLGDAYTNQFSYANDYYDPIEHQFRGFENATQSEFGNDSQGAPTLITQFRFNTGKTNESLKGKTLRVETDTAMGQIFYRQTNSWIPRPLNLPTFTNESRIVTFPYESDELMELVELGQETNAITLEKAFDYDNFGNQIFSADYGQVVDGNRAAGNDERLYYRQFSAEYPSGTNIWLLNRLAEEDVTDINSNIFARKQVFYDDKNFSGNNLGFVSLGSPTLVRDWISITNNTFRSTVRNEYDAYGNVTGMYDPLGVPGQPNQGHYRQVAFDSQIHTWPIAETIYTANPDAIVAGLSQPLLITQANYDFGLGVMTSATDFNTNTTWFGADTFGRITSITKPYDSTNLPTEQFSYILQAQVSGGQIINSLETDLRQIAGTIGTFASRSFYDGMGRKVMTRTQSETNGVVVVNGVALFNQRRAIWRSFLPYFESGTLSFNHVNQAGPYVESQYDALGRETFRSQPPTPPENYRAVTQTTYGPLNRFVQDEEQTQPSSPHFGAGMLYMQDGLRGQDGNGRLRQLEEIVHLSDTGQVTGKTNSWVTQYSYDPIDNFLGYTDSQGNQNFFKYDSLSRKTLMNDPDRGGIQWGYDLASNVTNTIDAKGQKVVYNYDGVNRLQAENYLDGNPLPPWRSVTQATSESGSHNIIYHYDIPYQNVPVGDGTITTATNTMAKLAWVEDLSGEEHTSYDARGRIVFTIKRLPDLQFLYTTNSGIGQSLVSYCTRFGLDSLDRLTSLVYPDNDAIGYSYNNRNLLQSIEGGANHLTQGGAVIGNLSYQASAQLSSIGYGNGILTQYGYDPRLRLTSITTAPATNSSSPLISFGYAYDDASNVKTINDNRPSSVVPSGNPRRNTQLFGYDDRYRITSAGYNFDAPGDSTINGGSIAYHYDRIGNILGQTSSINDFDSLTGLPVANLGQMASGGTSGTFNRLGRTATDPPGPHALTSIKPASTNSATRAYPYDANGNMVVIDGLTNTWDFKDRLDAVENGQMRAVYIYDYADRRVAKTVSYKPGATNLDSSITTLYVNKYFEVRAHDTPTKYIWNGNTRVACATGSLANNQRIQRLRIWPGLNLVSLVVDGGKLPTTTNLITAAYQWNIATLSWVPIVQGAGLSGGSVLWLQAVTNATLSFTGNYTDPTNVFVTTGPNFLPVSGFEALSRVNSSTLNSTNQWHFDAPNQVWQLSLSVTVTNFNSLPPAFSPGEVLFVRSDGATKLMPPCAELRLCYYHQDHLGSAFLLTDAKGQPVDETTYYAFGAERNRFRSQSSLFADYSYAQKEVDLESGIMCFGARYYCGSLSRFLSVDPSIEVTRTPYLYAANNPQRFVDPTGRASFDFQEIFFNKSEFQELGNGWRDTEGDNSALAYAERAVVIVGGIAAVTEVALNFASLGGEAVAKGVIKNAAKEVLEKELIGGVEQGLKKAAEKETVWNRLNTVGKTPGKTSTTGRAVIAQMSSDGKIMEDPVLGTLFQDSRGGWRPLAEGDMSHKVDAVTWWNETGRGFGAKSPEVRQWMLNPENYTIDYFRYNRSAGASIGETYLTPLK